MCVCEGVGVVKAREHLPASHYHAVSSHEMEDIGGSEDCLVTADTSQCPNVQQSKICHGPKAADAELKGSSTCAGWAFLMRSHWV